MLMSSVEFHVLCVEVGLDLGCHVVIGVVLFSPRRRNTKYRVLSFWILLSTCALVVRLYSVIGNSYL